MNRRKDRIFGERTVNLIGNSLSKAENKQVLIENDRSVREEVKGLRIEQSGTLKKLNDAEIAKRELEHQEYFDTELANEEHEKGIPL